jgi:DNA primase small subunit
MLLFYQRLFPFRHLFEWLNHSSSPQTDFTNRELAFTLQNDVYLRYLSFSSYSALKAQVIATNPKRFEIGPVYSANPRDRKSLPKHAFRPLEKELVFDIDLTDYDEIRTCCTKANICHKCWAFITIAIRVLDVALREDFGFQQILWVYSGRRGAHAWISDMRARKYDDHIRKSLVTYLEVIKGGGPSGKRVNVSRPLHPHLQRSLDICKKDFAKIILEDQDPWREQKGYERLLQLLPDKGLSQFYGANRRSQQCTEEEMGISSQ